MFIRVNFPSIGGETSVVAVTPVRRDSAVGDSDNRDHGHGNEARAHALTPLFTLYTVTMWWWQGWSWEHEARVHALLTLYERWWRQCHDPWQRWSRDTGAPIVYIARNTYSGYIDIMVVTFSVWNWDWRRRVHRIACSMNTRFTISPFQLQSLLVPVAVL